MGLLSTLEQLLIPGKQGKKQTVSLQEIICKPKEKNHIQTFNTAAVGCDYTNADGSNRQDALEKLKVGQKIRMLWDAGETGRKKTVYLTRNKAQNVTMTDCFGRLNDKVAAQVIRWLTQDKITTNAKVAKIVGGTRKRPKLGCVIELSTYQAPHVSEE